MRTAQVAVMFALLLLLAAALLAQTASSPVYTSQAITLPPSFFDQCTGDTVELSGAVTVNTTVWVDANGATHVRTNTLWDESGIGQPSGLSYTVIGQSATVENTTTNVAEDEISWATRMQMNGSGPLPNEVQRQLFHTTRNADGTTVNTLDGQLVTICTGK